jgi:hypothetical protein
MATKQIAVKRIGVGAFGKVIGTATALVGLVVGTVTTIGYFVGASYDQGTSFGQALGFGTGVAAVAILLYPLVAFLFGYVYGVILAWFVNIVLSQSQTGILLDIEDQKR